MDKGLNMLVHGTFFFFFLFSSLFISFTTSSEISAIYAIGDSTIDAGNNDYIATAVRSDHQPYGRDLDEGHVATGRFSNGKLITDILVSKLGLKDLLPAYLDPIISDHDLQTGVSFASAGSGFDDRTAEISNVIPMDKQIDYFEQCKDRISASVGVEVAEKIVNDAIFLISAGTNDLVWNYYDLPTRKVDFTISGYHDFLLQKLQSLVEKIYSLGGRKFAIAGLAPIGCLPIQITAADILPFSDMPRACVPQQNDDAMAYNMKLQGLVIWMQGSLSGTKIAYVDTYNQIMDMVLSPTKYGLEETSRGCCGTGLAETGALCNSLSLTCPDASNYLFWDAIHPTQAVYQVLANKFLETVIPQLSEIRNGWVDKALSTDAPLHQGDQQDIKKSGLGINEREQKIRNNWIIVDIFLIFVLQIGVYL